MSTISTPTRTAVVSWTVDNPRSRDLAEALGAELVLMPWARPRQRIDRRVAGWVRSARATRHALDRLPEGSAVVVMCPPVFAALVALSRARRGRLRVVVDAHSGTWNDPSWAWSRPLVRRLLRHVDLLVVTSPEVLAIAADAELVADLAEREATVRRGLVPAVALHDPVRMGDTPARPVARDVPLIVFPASGASDEPLAALSRAAELLGTGVKVVATGDWRHDISPALHRTGYLTRQRYESLLAEADVVLALSDREATLQRSAYEAVEVGVPLVCSDTAVLRATFGGAAVFTGHSPEDLATSIQAALDDRARLAAGSHAVARRLENERRAGLELLREVCLIPVGAGAVRRGPR